MRFAAFKLVLIALLGSLIGGCGGGGSSSDSSSDDGGSAQVTLSGRAAVGAPIAEAMVEARCADGSGFANTVMTDSSGRFEGNVGDTALPCALRVNGGTPETTLYSFTEVAGNVNITPLTDLIIAVAVSADPAVWYEADDQVQVGGLATATEEFVDTLRSQGYDVPGNEFDPFRTSFVIGDESDRLLDALMTAIAAMPNVDGYDAFVDIVSSGNLASVPQAPATPNDGTGGNNGGGDDNGGGNGNGGGSASGSAGACLSTLIDQQGTVLELSQRSFEPVSGDVIGESSIRQEVLGMATFKGNTARVMETRTTTDYEGVQSTQYGRQYIEVDEAALVMRNYGWENLDGENGDVTVTQWPDPYMETRFDLSPGETYRQIYTSYQSVGDGEPTIQSNPDTTVTYVGRETVTVPAGTFETCKFYTRNTGSPVNSATISWINVDDGLGVQSGFLDSDGNEMVITVVLSYSINGVQQAP